MKNHRTSSIPLAAAAVAAGLLYWSPMPLAHASPWPQCDALPTPIHRSNCVDAIASGRAPANMPNTAAPPQAPPPPPTATAQYPTHAPEQYAPSMPQAPPASPAPGISPGNGEPSWCGTPQQPPGTDSQCPVTGLSPQGRN